MSTGLTYPIDEQLIHIVSSIAKPGGVDAAGDPTAGTPIPDVRCFYEATEREWTWRTGVVVKTRALFFFGPENGRIPEESTIIFDGDTYEAIRCDTLYGDWQTPHHYEVWCR
jgi:hypothetical protein